jgi:predicted LPLAT superfamily acyltransferase
MSSESNEEKARWESTRERSTPFMLKLLIRCALLLGRNGVRPIVYATVAYFMLTSSSAKRASRDFLLRALGHEPTLRDVWRHFFFFASCSVDRIFFLTGRNTNLQINITRPEDVLRISNRGQGCLLVLAHFGSFEVLRLAGDKRSLPITILLDRQIGQMLTGLFERLNPDFAKNVIDASQRGPELVLALKEAIERNRMIGIMGDRTRDGDRSVSVNFMGTTAKFPVGPWILAGALGVPVILGFGIYRGGKQYDVHFELLSERIVLPRASRETAIAQSAQDYAHRLERYAHLAPYNWFNFYDFWL